MVYGDADRQADAEDMDEELDRESLGGEGTLDARQGNHDQGHHEMNGNSEERA